VVVVRWYGGVKLGTGGLGRAYRDTAAGALRLAQPLDRYLYERVQVIVPFPLLSTVYRLIAPPDVLLVGETYGEENEFTFEVRRSKAGEFAKTLVEKRLR
jgi:putative IMPACT (imprinted ancient) family translation regulator